VEIVKAKGAKTIVLTKNGLTATSWLSDRQVPISSYASCPANVSPTVIFETTGQDEERLAALNVCKPGSTIAFIGSSGTTGTLDLNNFIQSGGTLISIPGPHPDLLPELVALHLKNELDLDFVTEISLAELGEKLKSDLRLSSVVIDLQESE
jgi:threonine dehydrogenase-like Zn-dependent dehydrogenase